MAKQCGAGAWWRQPDFAFTMSGMEREIGAVPAKRKSKALRPPKWCGPQFAPIVGANCDPLVKIPARRPASRGKTHGNARFHAFGTAYAITAATPASRRASHLITRELPMKNLAFLAVAFALSFGLMAATVAVPTPFFA